jgi:TolA-binding protein
MASGTVQAALLCGSTTAMSKEFQRAWRNGVLLASLGGTGCIATQRDQQALEARTAKLEVALADSARTNGALRGDLDATRQRLDNALRASADSNLDFVSTKQRLNDLAGRVDEANHGLEEVRRDLAQSRTEIYARLDDMKRGQPAPAAPVAQAVIPADKTSHLAQLQAAFAKKEWPLVRALGAEYANRYAGDEKWDEATWMVAEADLADGRPTAALAGYNRLLKASPRSTVLGKTLFGMGEAYMLLRDCENAKLAYDAVEKRFAKEKVGADARARLATIAKNETGTCTAR